MQRIEVKRDIHDVSRILQGKRIVFVRVHLYGIDQKIIFLQDVMIDLWMSRCQSKLCVGRAVLVARPWDHDQVEATSTFEFLETKRLIVINY